ncbi:unnamed protein product [Vitrella brassicaformis CCMP3155]|uniref:Uncharacterized protein n=1 Tax=Vitrella brassicaformis (strain CCMP3155) TaxID=1169540 RepID=A0A0G4H635_VITBC|nr:unnamed protein product [Vitrella brassicaformis CCMP3155]|eukprot:CEM39317.1 unnamed protein product [Vitrella brassicaformis CCMP3155]
MGKAKKKKAKTHRVSPYGEAGEMRDEDDDIVMCGGDTPDATNIRGKKEASSRKTDNSVATNQQDATPSKEPDEEPEKSASRRSVIQRQHQEWKAMKSQVAKLKKEKKKLRKRVASERERKKTINKKIKELLQTTRKRHDRELAAMGLGPASHPEEDDERMMDDDD